MNQVRLLSLALLVLASPLLAQEEPAAVKKARAAVAKNSKDADAQLALADALLAINEPEDAWSAVEKAVEEVPTDGRLDLKLGDIFVILAQKEAAGGADGTTIQNFFMDAERMFDAAFQKNDKLAAALCGKAFVNLQMNRKDKARKAAADALGIDKNHGRAHALQGYMFYLDQKYDAACNKYEISLKLDKSDPMDNLRLGHCYVRLNQ
ncbi:MAG: tetratricopeptide repeat protein, partial [Planctomycetota bacterium]